MVKKAFKPEQIIKERKQAEEEVILSNILEIAEIVHINPLYLPVSGINSVNGTLIRPCSDY